MVVVLAIVACRPEGRAPSRATEAPTSGTAVVPRPSDACSLVETARDAILLPDGRSVYAEAHGLHRLGRGFVLVGMPTYEWVIAANGAGSYVADRRFIGVVVQPGEDVTTIPPIPDVGHLTWVRSVLHDDGTLSVLGPESSGLIHSESRTLRLIYAEYAEGRWTSSETLAVSGHTLDFDTSSELLEIEGEVAWAAVGQTTPAGPWPVLLLRGRSGRMRHEHVLQHRPDRLMLHAGPNGLVLGVAGNDPMYGRQRVTLDLLLTASGAPLARFAAADDGRVRTPRALTRPDGLTVAWAVESPRGWTSWVATGIGSGARARPRLLTEGSEFFALVPLGDRAALVVTDRRDPLTGAVELRFYRAEGSDVASLGALPSPYTGPFNALAISDSEILVVGADDEPSAPFPYVRSLVIRLSLSC